MLAYSNLRTDSGMVVSDFEANTDNGIDAILSQVQPDGTKRVFAYGSHSLHKPERNYCEMRKVRTDHHAVTWLRSFKEPWRQVARWLERLQEYDMDMIHRPGWS